MSIPCDWIKIGTPLGGLVFEPGKDAADPAFQKRMQALGITVEIGSGPAPRPDGRPPLVESLCVLGLGGAALAAWALWKREQKLTEALTT